MTPTKRHVNWASVTVATQAITGVSNVDVDPGGALMKYSGDGDKFHTTIVSDVSEPKVTIASNDMAAIRSLPNGTRGAFSATQVDAKNGVVAGGGAIIYSSATAVVDNNPTGGAHRQFAAGQLVLAFESIDGVTNPLGSAAA